VIVDCAVRSQEESRGSRYDKTTGIGYLFQSIRIIKNRGNISVRNVNSSQHRYNPYGRVFRRGDGRIDRGRQRGKGGGGGRKRRSVLKPEQLEHLKQCMAKRFDGSHQALDLNNIYTDPDLVSQKIKVILNRKTSMEAIIKIIEEHVPELTCLNLSNNRIQRLDELSKLVTKVPHLKTLNLSHNKLKSERELDKLKGLKLEELWLVRNPFCALFKDQSSFISAVRQRFPQLLKLNGNDLPPPIGFDVETPTTIPSCKGSCFGSDFITVPARNCGLCIVNDQLFNRKATTEQIRSTFVAPAPTPSSSPGLKLEELWLVRNPFCALFKDQSSFISAVRQRFPQLLKLNGNDLPPPIGFDVETPTTIPSCKGSCFGSDFITVPARNCGLCIVNDQLFNRKATTEQIRSTFVAPAPTPSSSPVPTLTTPQQEMLTWDSNRAAQIFTQLKTEGKIPDVAFLK
uniref:TAP-C domain-containing protein n=1 Tax=Gouania willdenowi TaxID=441366 RepID=A0A8C5DBQ8_GOUWI